MDELVRHCIREISFDGDLGESTIFLSSLSEEASSIPSVVDLEILPPKFANSL